MAITVAMQQTVAAMYAALFNRAPEKAGLDFWCGQLDSGVSLAAMAQTMYETAPARATYPDGISNADVVKAFYLNVLGRAGDAEGLAFWEARLNTLGTKGALIAEMVANVQSYTGTDPAGVTSKALFDNKVTVGFAYAVTLGKEDVELAKSVLALVTATDTAAALSAANVGQTFTLTTSAAGDTVIGTSGNDKVSALVAATGTTFTSADVIVDSSTTDSDTLTLATSANIAAGADARVSGIENVVINHTSFTNGSFDLANVKAAKITVNNLQAAGADGVTLTGLTQGSSVVAGSGVTGTVSATTGNSVTSLTVEGGEATGITVGQANGGTAAAIALHVKSNATGTTNTPVSISIEGSAATAKDSATVEAKGIVNLDTDGATADQVENVTLIGNGAAATFTVVGAPTAITVSGSQNVTVAGTAATFSGKTVTDASTATSKLKVQTTAAALDLTKVSVDTVELAIDMVANAVTVDSAEALQVSTNQTSLTLTSAATTKATNEVSITVDDNAATTSTIALGTVAATNLAKVNVVATDNVTVGNNATFGADAVVNFSGAGTVTVGTGVTAKEVNASAGTGVLTAAFGTNLLSITGGSAKDVLTVSADQNFTAVGGAGQDTLVIASATTNLNFADNTAVKLDGIEVVQFDDDGLTAVTHTFASSHLTGKAIVVKGEGATTTADVLAVAMDGTTLDLSGLNADTASISKVSITAGTVAASALTITGTSMVDEVSGGSQADTIKTGEGNDVIVDAGDGDDVIDTGAGDDTVTDSGAGNDHITLGTGTNVVTQAGAGNDTIIGGTGTDTVTDAGAGNDVMNLGNGTNTAYGNSGDDVITGGTGVDTFTGGADKDTLNGDAGADKLFGDNAGNKEVATLTIGGVPANTNTVAVTLFGRELTVTLDATTAASVATASAAVKAAIDAAFGDVVTTGTIAAGAFTITSKLDGNLVDFTVAAGGGGATAAFSAKADGSASAGGVDTINAGAGADFVFAGEGKDVVDLGAADTDADVVAYTTLAAAEAGDEIKNFEAATGNDIIKFAQSAVLNGTSSATLASVAANGTIGLNDVFVKITNAAAAGAVDTAAEMVTFLTNLGTANMAANDVVLVAANDGTDTYLWAYAETGATAGAQAAELTLVTKLVGVTNIENGDIAFI